MLAAGLFSVGCIESVYADTYQVTSGKCTGPETLYDAIGKANATIGLDTIEIRVPITGWQWGACSQMGPKDLFPVTITDPLVIDGGSLTGNDGIHSIQQWVASSGQVNDLGMCPASDIFMIPIDVATGGFRIGLPGQDNNGLAVTIRNLKIQGLLNLAQVNKNASLTLDNVQAKNIWDIKKCTHPAIEVAADSFLTVKNSSFDGFHNWVTNITGVGSGLISGDDAGNLSIQDSIFKNNTEAGAIFWRGKSGASVKIVSTQFIDSQGIIVYGPSSGTLTADIVNSVVATTAIGDYLANDQIFAGDNAVINLTASTVLAWNSVCNSRLSGICGTNGILAENGNGFINLIQSVVGLSSPGDALKPSNIVIGGSNYSADNMTWVQPVPAQDSAALKGILNQGNLLTGSPGLPTVNDSAFSLGYPARITPLLGDQSTPGVLIDVVPEADCVAGSGGNKLLNPINGDCITKDALGNPRVDGNHSRNIGAVQTTLAPSLVLSSVGDANAALNWNQVTSPASGPITGFRIYYRPIGSSNWSDKDVGLSPLQAIVTGLTNGTPYEFQVAGLNTAGSGPTSNTVTGTPLGGAPTARPDNYSTAKNIPLVVAPSKGVSINDADPNNGALTPSLVSPPQHGQIQLSGDGSLTYTPATGYVGSDTFQYSTTSSVSGLTSLSTSVTLNVATYAAGAGGSAGAGPNGATPIAPVANNDAWTVPFNTPLTLPNFGVLTNDFDPQGYQLRATVKDQPANGTLVLDPIGGFVYTPNTGFVGRDTFTYTVSNGVLSSVATVTLNVLGNGTNEPPIGNPDAYATPKDVILNVALPGVLANDYDPEGATLSATIQDQPTHGLLALSTQGHVSYFPQSGYIGTDTFTYVPSDGVQTGNPVRVTISIRDPATDQAPEAHPDQWSTAKGTTLAVAPQNGILLNDHDAEGNTLKITYLTQPTNGMFAPVDGGGFVYTPNGGFTGNDSFTYSVSDGIKSSAPATVTFRVNANNRLPRARNNHYPLREDEILDVYGPGILANDVDPEGHELTPIIKRYPQHGALALQLGGGFTYIPDLYYHGKDSFAYTVTDGELESKPATVKFTIKKPSRKVLRSPRAGRNRYSLPVGSVLSVPARGLLGNDRDPQGDPLLVYLDGPPSHGSVHLGIDGSFRYYPEEGFTGDDQFTYRVYDGLFSSKPARVRLVVKTHEKAPRATGSTFQKSPNVLVERVNAPGLRQHASDKNGNYLTPFIEDYPKHGLLKLNPNGAFAYYPDKGFRGVDRFRWRVTDGLLDSNLATSVLDTRSGQ
jgi:hypothetical protein